MSNYTKSTNFAAKDALASGNAGKIVKGTEIDTEFNNIATAVSTKADLASPTFTGTPTLPTGTVAVTQLSNDDSTKLATTAFVQDVADAVKQALYPVGSIYTNATSSTNPTTLLGFGTWTAFGAGRVMVGLNAGNPLFDTAEETGGSADAIVVNHTHTATSTVTDPGHRHRLRGEVGGAVKILGAESGTVAGIGTTTGSFVDSGAGAIIMENSTTGITVATTNAATGSSGTNANYQPYITVYMWKRTA
jgi:hypothetical protein